MKSIGRIVALALFAAAIPASASAGTAAVGVPERSAEAIILKGAQTQGLIGVPPGDLVAFRWQSGWQQVPVQVDERKLVDYRILRQWRSNGAGAEPFFSSEVYADPGTYAGADGSPQPTSSKGPAYGPDLSNPVPPGDKNLDSNDEIAMMASDAGASAFGQANPPGIFGSSRTAILVEDPLDPDGRRFLYLFRRSGSLDPTAGRDYVNYEQRYSPLLAGGYFGGYNHASIGDNVNGPPVNPEASTISSDLYEQTFPGRWLIDGLRIKAGAATGVDILDGDKSTVGQTACGRNELTFSRGGGGVIAAIDGPVRAIRSYVGANSGTYTQRDQIYYRGLMVNNTYLRVHAGISDFVMAMDFNEAAFGMTYRNSLLNPGVQIDGVPDDIAGEDQGQFSWEQVVGEQGSVINVARIDTDVPGTAVGSYYQDDLSPPDDNDSIICSGDDHAIGASGLRIKMPGLGLNTDPTKPPTAPSTAVNNFTGHRFSYYGPPEESAETAALRGRQVDSPLIAVTGPDVDRTNQDNPPSKPGRQNWVGLKVSARPANLRLKPGASTKIRVKLRNIGDRTGRRVKICPAARKPARVRGSCKFLGKLRAGRNAERSFRIKLGRAKTGKRKLRIRFTASARGSKARSASVLVRPRGR